MPSHSDDRRRDEPPTWEALARFQDGAAAPDEEAETRAWLAAHPADAALLASLDATLTEHLHFPAAFDETVDVDAGLARVKARRAPDAAPARVISLDARRRSMAPRRRIVGAGLGIAAAAAAAVVGVVRLRGDDRAARLAPAGVQVATTVGQRDSVRLPDGTHVVLAPGSRLTVAERYGAGARDVTLEGAALFRVTHDEAAPFTVRAGGALVRDIGTVFTVRTDGVGEAGVAVAVTEGVVGLRAATSGAAETTLRAGDRGEVRAGGDAVPSRGAADSSDVSWASGRLEYQAVPLARVRADLRRWYGLDVRVEDSTLAARTITATFDASEPPGRVLDAIALSLGAVVERSGSSALLRPDTR